MYPKRVASMNCKFCDFDFKLTQITVPEGKAAYDSVDIKIAKF